MDGSLEFATDDDILATKVLSDSPTNSRTAGDTDLAAGQLLAGRFKVINLIGQGGMGSVYKAQDLYIKRTVALKLLHKEFASKPIVIQRFQKEVEAIAKLSHRSIVKVHDLGSAEDGCQYMVMDLVEGKSLDAILKEKHHLPVAEALDIITQVADAVQHAHANGVIHRDLKPSNIIISTDAQGKPQVRLVDFGIAKLVEPEGDNSKLTQTGDVFGSPQYMSPEQCRGEALDQRADIYAIGCILFEIITGQTAFSDENAVKTILKHLNEARPPISKELNVPASAVAVIDRCLEKRKEDRYSDCQQLLSDLKKLEEGKQVKRHVAADKQRARGKKILLALAALAILCPIIYSATIGRVNEAPPDHETGTATTAPAPISNSWQSLDSEGQKAMNKGNFARAEKLFTEAAQLTSSSAAERSRSFRKLALISHMKYDSKAEAIFDGKAIRMEEASDASNTSARLALKQAIEMLPTQLEPAQAANLSQLVKQINSLVDADIKAGHPHRDLSILDLSINKLKNVANIDEQSLPSLIASRCRAYLFERHYRDALEDAKVLNTKFRSANPETQLENQLLLSLCQSSTGQNHEAIENARDAMSKANSANLPSASKESLKARSSFLLGSLLIGTSKADEAKNLIMKSIEDAQSVEAVAPLLEWQLNGAVHAPDVFESVLTTVLRDSITTADPVVRSDYLTGLGDLYYRQTIDSAKPAQALGHFSEALKLRQSALPADSQKVRTSISKLVAVLNFLGQNGARSVDEPESIPLIKQWIASIQRYKAEEDDDKIAELIKAYDYLGKAGAANGDLNLTKAAMQRMFELVSKDPHADSPFDSFFYSNARQMLTPSQWQSIEPVLKARVKHAEKHSVREMWKAKDDLGHFYYATGRMNEAGEQIKSAVESIEKTDRKLLNPADLWIAAETIDNYAMYLRRAGNPDWQRYQKEAERMRYGDRTN